MMISGITVTATNGQSIPVTADVKGGFAIHRAINAPDGWWVVTHIKTGLACGVDVSLAAAKRRREVCLSLAVNDVSFGDMEACEAITLQPKLAEQFYGKIGVEVDPDLQRRIVLCREKAAEMLCPE